MSAQPESIPPLLSLASLPPFDMRDTLTLRSMMRARPLRERTSLTLATDRARDGVEPLNRMTANRGSLSGPSAGATGDEDEGEESRAEVALSRQENLN